MMFFKLTPTDPYFIRMSMTISKVDNVTDTNKNNLLNLEKFLTREYREFQCELNEIIVKLTKIKTNLNQNL